MTKLAFSAAAAAAPVPSGSELFYGENATDTTVNTTTPATANLVITAGAITFNGTTAIQFWTYAAATRTNTNALSLIGTIWDNGVHIWSISFAQIAVDHLLETPLFVISPKLTPTAGAHTFSWHAYCNIAGTATIFGNPLSATNLAPAYFRIMSV